MGDTALRKVLYSPGYGAGWVSWHSGSKAEKLFMLEYAPFIAYLEAKQKREEKKGSRIREGFPDELMEQFKVDWDAKFPDKAGEYPYSGGLGSLSIREVPTGALVRINEYDGSETVEVLGEYDQWL